MEIQKFQIRYMVLTMKTQNLQQKDGMLLTVSQKVIIHTPI